MSYKWQYHNSDQKGRGLNLLTIGEAAHFWTLIEKYFGKDFTLTESNKLYIHTQEVEADFDKMVRFKPFRDSLSLLDLYSLNQLINNFFSDEGWKVFRKSINKLKSFDKKQSATSDDLDGDLNVWDYSGVIPSKGKRLKPLSQDDLPLCLPIIHAYFSEGAIKKEHFRGVSFDENWQLTVMKKGREINRLISKFERRALNISNGELSAFNLMLNSLFSDDGWKLIRQRQAQRKRRTNKNLIELTSETVDKLNSLKEELSFNSYDETISYLFVESQENPEVTKLHNTMAALGIETYQDLISTLIKNCK